MSERINILSVGFDNVSMSEAVEQAAALITDGGTHYAATPNSEIVYDCIKNRTLREYISRAGMVLPDGSGIILGGKILGTPLKEKVAGADFAVELCKWLVENDRTLFLLGAKPGVAEKAAVGLCEQAPGLKIAGIRNGYFREDSDAVREINVVAPDVLFVCLGSPRQEDFIRLNLARLDVKFAIGLGGSLDIYAGELKRAPRWMINGGFEWLYRLIQQPSRVGRMMRLPKFVFAVMRSRKSLKRSK